MQKRSLLRELSSLKLTVILLSAIAVLSLIGTVVAQGQPPEFYAERYGSFFTPALLLLGIPRIYRSALFFFALLMLGLNLSCCLLRTAVPFWQAGGTKRAVTFFHAGVLILFCGALISGLLRQTAYYQLQPGDILSIPRGATDIVVRDFEIDFYDDSSRPREYRTLVTLRPQKGPPQERLIRVNHPLAVSGYTLYQSSFEVMAQAAVRLMRDGTLLWEGVLDQGEPVGIGAEKNLTLALEACIPDAGNSRPGQVQARSYQLRDPALLIAVYEDEQLRERCWWSQTGPLSTGDPDFVCEVTDVDMFYATILKTVKDPGFPLVCVGFLVMGAAMVWYIFKKNRGE